MAELKINDSGTWRTIQQIYVNDGGTWRTVFQYVRLSTTITVGQSTGNYGYGQGSFGSVGNATLGDGKVLYLIDDFDDGIGVASYLTIEGFSSDPGASYVSTVVVNGTSVDMSTGFSYAYNSGTGRAVWTDSFGYRFGLIPLNGSTVSLVINP